MTTTNLIAELNRIALDELITEPEISYICAFCEKEFKDFDGARTHIKTHLKEMIDNDSSLWEEHLLINRELQKEEYKPTGGYVKWLKKTQPSEYEDYIENEKELFGDLFALDNYGSIRCMKFGNAWVDFMNLGRISYFPFGSRKGQRCVKLGTLTNNNEKYIHYTFFDKLMGRSFKQKFDLELYKYIRENKL